MKATLGLFSLFGFGCCLAEVGGQRNDAVSLSKRDNSHFKEEAFTGSSYVQFRTNGTYSRIDREHMFVEESDRGTWTQNSRGLVTMHSSMHCRNIESGPLAIWTWHTNIAQELRQIHSSIGSLVHTNSSQHFEADFIGERLILLPSRGTNLYSPISVDSQAKQISRGQLLSLMQAIEVFTNRTDNHHFHVRPMEYKGITFLLWQDTGTPLNRSLVKIRKSIDLLKGKEKVLPLIYTAISRKQFEKEANTRQAFIFYPEMNKPRKEPPIGEK